MVIHKSFSDFLLFLYVHMSDADAEYDPAEMAVIKKKMADLFPSSVDFEQKLYLTIREYNSFDKSQLDELFKDTLLYFQKEESEREEKMFNDIREIISADGSMNESESKALESFRKMIEAVIPHAGRR